MIKTLHDVIIYGDIRTEGHLKIKKGIMFTDIYNGAPFTEYGLSLNNRALADVNGLTITNADLHPSGILFKHSQPDDESQSQNTYFRVMNGDIFVHKEGATPEETNKVYHTGNDGDGSNMDADLLDGHHASYFATEDHEHNTTTGGLGEDIQLGDGLIGNIKQHGGLNKVTASIYGDKEVDTDNVFEISLQKGEDPSFIPLSVTLGGNVNINHTLNVQEVFANRIKSSQPITPDGETTDFEETDSLVMRGNDGTYYHTRNTQALRNLLNVFDKTNTVNTTGDQTIDGVKNFTAFQTIFSGLNGIVIGSGLEKTIRITKENIQASNGEENSPLSLNPNGGTILFGHYDSGNKIESSILKALSPQFTGIPTAPTAAIGNNTTQIATTAYVKSEIDSVMAANDAMIYKGDLPAGSTLPAANCGWTYKVSSRGTIGEFTVEVGDTLICFVDNTPAGNSANWNCLQTNIEGYVLGAASAIVGHVPLFDNTNGKVLKTSGFPISYVENNAVVLRNSSGWIISSILQTTAISSSEALLIRDNSGNVQKILTSGLLASNIHNDSSKIPLYGIYSKGDVRIGNCNLKYDTSKKVLRFSFV